MKTHIIISVGNTVKGFLCGDGAVTLENNYSSPSIIREALKKEHPIKIIEESSSRLKCKIFRSARLFGGPVPFPNPTLTMDLNYDATGLNIKYYFEWPDYYVAVAASITLSASFSFSLMSYVLLIIANCIAVFIDNRWFVSKYRKLLFSI